MARDRRPSGRLKEWTGSTVGEQNITTTQALLSSQISPVLDQTYTHIRLRGELLFVAVPNAAADHDIAAIGAIVVQEQAIAAGGVSLPGPIADPEADWLWHQYVPLRSAAATAANDEAIGLFARVTVDSKAMRKIKKDQELVLVVESSTGEFASITVQGGVRALVLLS